MIIVKFYGGLGNQMLQYATYAALQERYPGTRVVADISKYNYLGVHNGFEIERLFPIRLNILFGKKLKKVSLVEKYGHYILQTAAMRFFKIGLNKFRLIKDNNILNKDLFHLDPHKHYFLDGYWGNEKYFENAKELIRKNFTFKIPLDPVNEAVAKNITSQNSVSVHIRRGDFMRVATPMVDLNSTDYYPRSFEYLHKTMQAPAFYVFSDDIEWCKDNLRWLDKYEHYFVKGNVGMESYKDMQLMSLCKHNILGNSTFSWWGGWLNNNPRKVVICPVDIYNDPVKNAKILAEFYPDSWVKM